MKETATRLTEYGLPIDPDAMVTPPDVTELELEPGHPGLGDEGYIQRRKELFALCRKHRLENLGPPLIDYNAEETRIWREVSPKLDELHLQYACRIYLNAKRELAITRDEIPQLRHLSDRVRRETNMHLVPAEGALPYRTFYEYIAQRGFPVTQFIRHGSHPEFTPEPDMIHDCLGHVPPLMNQDYAELVTLIGKAAATTRAGEQLLALKRFSWFSIEFGLIEEAGATKVFGAGIPVLDGRDPYSINSPEVTREPFVTDVVINTDYDPSRMQDHLFIAPSFPFLRRELEALVRRFGIPVL
jgi:phenylalanine-4-hydroxylase